MTAACLLADESFPLPVSTGLRRLGHDVETLAELGLAGCAAPDDAVPAEATRLGRCVLTLDRRDFLRLHHATSLNAGIVLCTFDPDFDGQAARIDAALRAAPDDLAGRLLRVNRPSL